VVHGVGPHALARLAQAPAMVHRGRVRHQLDGLSHAHAGVQDRAEIQGLADGLVGGHGGGREVGANAGRTLEVGKELHLCDRHARVGHTGCRHLRQYLAILVHQRAGIAHKGMIERQPVRALVHSATIQHVVGEGAQLGGALLDEGRIPFGEDAPLGPTGQHADGWIHGAHGVHELAVAIRIAARGRPGDLVPAIELITDLP